MGQPQHPRLHAGGHNDGVGVPYCILCLHMEHVITLEQAKYSLGVDAFRGCSEVALEAENGRFTHEFLRHRLTSVVLAIAGPTAQPGSDQDDVEPLGQRIGRRG